MANMHISPSLVMKSYEVKSSSNHVSEAAPLKNVEV